MDGRAYNIQQYPLSFTLIVRRTQFVHKRLRAADVQQMILDAVYSGLPKCDERNYASINMGLPWDYQGLTMRLPRDYYGILRSLPWAHQGIAMGLKDRQSLIDGINKGIIKGCQILPWDCRIVYHRITWGVQTDYQRITKKLLGNPNGITMSDIETKTIAQRVAPLIKSNSCVRKIAPCCSNFHAYASPTGGGWGFWSNISTIITPPFLAIFSSVCARIQSTAGNRCRAQMHSHCLLV